MLLQCKVYVNYIYSLDCSIFMKYKKLKRVYCYHSTLEPPFLIYYYFKLLVQHKAAYTWYLTLMIYRNDELHCHVTAMDFSLRSSRLWLFSLTVYWPSWLTCPCAFLGISVPCHFPHPGGVIIILWTVLKVEMILHKAVSYTPVYFSFLSSWTLALAVACGNFCRSHMSESYLKSGAGAVLWEAHVLLIA